MSRLSVLCVCLAAVMFPAVSSKKAAMSRHQLELKEHYEHLAKIAEFECDHPQPRLLHVNELLSDFQIRGKAYFPEVTVLHRCDRHVGSCNDAAHQCGPTNTLEVRMPFKVTFLEAMGGRAVGEWQMEYHPLVNHTTCGCTKAVAVPPSKTAVHYHYVDPALVPPQLPLESPHAPQGNASSYEVPVYNTPSRNASEGPSIYDMTQMAEKEVQPKPIESEQKPEEEIMQSKPIEIEQKPDEGTRCSERSQGSDSPSCQPSEPPVEDDRVTATASSTVDDWDDKNDADATTIPDELIRMGSDDSPRSQALTDNDSPYDSYLKQSLGDPTYHDRG